MSGTTNAYELLIRSVVDYAIYMLDVDGTVVNWNTGAERIKGYTAMEIVGRNFACFYTAEDQEAGVPQKALRMAA
jgi:PAS domain S-box-containing protein